MNFRLSKPTLSAIFVASAFFATAANAAEQHAGDAQPYLSGGKVQMNASFFEADFGDLSGGLYKTDDPGYDADTAKGAFGAGNWLQVAGIGTLKFWDGSAWNATVPNGEQIRIKDALDNDAIFTSSGVTGPSVIGQFDAAGDIHEHLDLSIYNASNTLGGTVGAYWISLYLFESAPNSSTPINTPSDPFNIIFNRGLSSVAYETAVEAAVNPPAPVPVPAAVYMFGSALAGLLTISRRRAVLA